MGSGRTRLPVCRRESGIDGPLGLVHVYDLLAAALGETVELGELKLDWCGQRDHGC